MTTFVLVGLSLLLLGNLILLRRFHNRTSELANSEQRYRKLFEGSALCMCELDLSEAILALRNLDAAHWDETGNLLVNQAQIQSKIGERIKLISANPTTLSLFEVHSIEQLAANLSRLLTPASLDTFRKWSYAVHTQVSRFSDETEFLTCNGKTIRTLISLPMPENLMEATRVPMSLLDITQQKQTEKQLSQVIQGAALGFWDWEIESGRHYVNDRWLQILGLDRKDINECIDDWSCRLHPEDRKRVEPIVQDHINRRLPYVVEFRMRHQQGHWVWIQGSGSGVEYTPEAGKPIRACGTHQRPCTPWSRPWWVSAATIFFTR